MPRRHRIILPNHPHHLYQQGNRKQTVFFNDIDRRYYLKLLFEETRKWKVVVWAYCLMTNHIHVICVPETSEGLARAFGEIHRSYTAMINHQRGWRGHLWQGRFGTSVMDGLHLLRGLRYVERNPVRAGMIIRPEDYPWSSARHHVDGHPDKILSECPVIVGHPDWRRFIHSTEPVTELETLRKYNRKGLPQGDETFIQRVATLTGIAVDMLKPKVRAPSRRFEQETEGRGTAYFQK